MLLRERAAERVGDQASQWLPRLRLKQLPATEHSLSRREPGLGPCDPRPALGLARMRYPSSPASPSTAETIAQDSGSQTLTCRPARRSRT